MTVRCLTRVVLVPGLVAAVLPRLPAAGAADPGPLPMSGRADSLNVSVAAGVMMYELMRRRNATTA